MAGVGSDKATTNIESIAGVLISGKVPTTAAGGGSNVAIINVSGQVPVTAGNLPLNASIVNVSGQIPVTAGGVPLPVNVVQTSAQVHVTAGNAPVPVSIQGVNHAVSSLGVQAGLRGDMVFNALVSNPVKFAKLPQVAGAVCADIVAAVASRKIRVLGAYLNSTGTATAIFMTTGASAALTPKIAMNTGFVLPVSPHGWFETAVGSALSLQIEGGSIGGIITYCEVF